MFSESGAEEITDRVNEIQLKQTVEPLAKVIF
jgi:hypothetical protein